MQTTENGSASPVSETKPFTLERQENPMSDMFKKCDVCHQSVVSWPQIFTVLGPRDLCGTCYWRYRELVEQLDAFFSGQHADS